MEVILTALGLAFSVFGTGCGVVAFLAGLREHDPNPVWPMWSRAVGGVRRGALAIAARVGRKRREQTVLLGSVGAAVEVSGAGSLTVGFGKIPTDAPVEEQLRLVVARLEAMHVQAAEDRKAAERRGEELRRELAAESARLREADARVEDLARDLTLGSARLQLLGLLTVGVGAILTALPVLLGA
ncbi:hypothetical protein ACQP04_13000 [Pseudonocardia halophobica]|uniref:hypothetical protein n=1 Tax=Pseudonocardia halophobica TaxID=29401 RepID=UPI003D8DA77E